MSGNLEVKIVAIDEDNAILESTAKDKGMILFKWPLENLPPSYQVGDCFLLELKKNSAPQLAQITSQKKEEEKYRLLESLIN